jgi:type III pantothenate kinase
MTDTVLLLDVGNSRVKWALVDPPEWLAEGAATHGEIDTLLREWARFPAPAGVIAASVASEERAQRISSYWQARDVPLRWIRASPASAGVRNLYACPGQLGSDRWAALIGARARVHGACLVVSAGTAVTIDALNEQGEFLGGLILPGRRLMQQSLAAGTHALEEEAGEAVDFPRNTADAMASGIATALASAVQTAFQRLAGAGAKSTACILTGGDAEWLARQLQIGVIIAPRLVLEGLLIMALGDDQK